MRGFDNELFLNIKKTLRQVPLIYCSGAGNKNHFKILTEQLILTVFV